MKKFFQIVLGSLVGSLLALLLAFFLLMGLIGSVASLSESKPSVPKSAILSLDFSKPITEQSEEDLFALVNPLGGGSAKSNGLLQMLQSIERAAEDPAIKFIYMDLTNLNAGLTHIEEIKRELERFRESGKPIIAYSDNYSQGGYYLSTVADKIYLSPSGMLPLTGVSVSILFFKDLLEKMGIEMQLVRHGKFKAAAEQFISNKMSKENREQLQAFVDAVWESWVEQIANSRGITPERINELVDNLSLSTAEDALNSGLVDELLYKDGVNEMLMRLFDVEKERDLKIISSSSYHKATHKVDYKEKNKVAIIYADGEIVMGKSDKGIASDSFINHISKVRRDSTIKAVVLRVNSPGGSAQSSDLIERELELLREKKPVVVSMGDYAASGGYWISANADRIYTNRTTLTGSIGVFSMVPNFGEGVKKHLSLNRESVNSNRYSDLMSGYRALEEAEIQFLKRAVEQIYTQFLELVAEGREMSVEEVDEVAQGRVWAGSDALNVGLADEEGGLYQALHSAAAMGGLESYRVVEYPVKKSALDKMMESLTNSTKAVELISDPAQLIERSYTQLKGQKELFHFARLPYNISIN